MSPLDILVQRLPGAVIPETGTTGQATRAGLFSLTIDSNNPNFAHSLRDGDLRRTVAHEAHHCMRMAGPGYGWTLSEALVSEGLAGQFVSRLSNSPPEPWECAVTDEVLAANLPDNATLVGTGTTTVRGSSASVDGIRVGSGTPSAQDRGRLAGRRGRHWRRRLGQRPRARRYQGRPRTHAVEPLTGDR